MLLLRAWCKCSFVFVAFGRSFGKKTEKTVVVVTTAVVSTARYQLFFQFIFFAKARYSFCFFLRARCKCSFVFVAFGRSVGKKPKKP